MTECILYLLVDRCINEQVINCPVSSVDEVGKNNHLLHICLTLLEYKTVITNIRQLSVFEINVTSRLKGESVSLTFLSSTWMQHL